jgi:hypothetical protein
MAMVVHVPGRNQGRHVARDQRALLYKAQADPVAVLADCIPPLMGLHPADGAMLPRIGWRFSHYPSYIRQLSEARKSRT